MRRLLAVLMSMTIVMGLFFTALPAQASSLPEEIQPASASSGSADSLAADSSSSSQESGPVSVPPVSVEPESSSSSDVASTSLPASTSDDSSTSQPVVWDPVSNGDASDFYAPPFVPFGAGVSFGLRVAKSMDGTRPATFNASDSVDLTTVTRYSMYYAYFELSIANSSGADMVNPTITMQLPKLADPNYYEPMSPNYPPAGWVAYANTPSGDGNATFPAANLTTNATTRIMTWTSAASIPNGSSGTIYIKLPFRDPYTNFGTYTYNPTLSYTSSGSAQTSTASADFTISGLQDTYTQSITQVTNLGYVPSETDAANYYYVAYQFSHNFNANYSLPAPAQHLDQAFVTTPSNIMTLPADAQIISATSGTITGNTITGMTSGAKIYVRYPKANYPNSTDTVTVSATASGRFAGQSATTNPIANSAASLTVAVGSSVIPAGALGTVTASLPVGALSRETLANNGHTNLIYGNPSGLNIHSTARNNSTIMAKEMNFTYKNANWVVGGNNVNAVYSLGQIQVMPPTFSTPPDNTNPVSMTVTITMSDGSTDVNTFTQAQLLNSAKFGAPIYHGNVPAAYGRYAPPAGLQAVGLNIKVTNVPPGFGYTVFIDGWVQTTGFDLSAATGLNNNYYVDLIGTDNTVAGGSGDKTTLWPIVSNTTIQPSLTINRTTANTLNPGSTDTWALKANYGLTAKQSLINPEFDVLLPAGFSFVSFTNQALQDQTIGTLATGIFTNTSPVTTVVNNYNGTGRTLVRLKYTGILQFNENISGQMTVKAGNYLASGSYTAEAFLSADNANFSNILDGTNTPIVTDTNDVNMNSSASDKVFRQTLALNVTQGTGTNLYSVMQGGLDPAFTSQANTKQGRNVNGQLVLSYNGSTTMNDIVLVGILPNENDGYTIFGQFLDGDHATLAQAVDVSAYPGATVYYNTSATNSPTDANWTTTYTSSALSVKVVMPSSYNMVSGGNTSLTIPVVMTVPAAATGADLLYVAGKGQLQVYAYASNVLAPTGLVGAPSYVKSISLGINAKIFNDIDKDKSKGSSESWGSGLTVKLFNGTDDITTATPLYTGTTDSNGEYWFADGVGGVTLNMQSYKLVYTLPDSNQSFDAAGGSVTTDNTGVQAITLNTITPMVNSVAGYYNSLIDVKGNIWSDGENPSNGIYNSGTDSFFFTKDRTVKLYNLDTSSYFTTTAFVSSTDGSYIIPNVPVGPRYRVDFALNAGEDVSPIPSAGSGTRNNMAKVGSNASATFNSAGMANGASQIINGAMTQSGTITVKFVLNGTTTQVGVATTVTRVMPTSYTATIGSVQDTTGATSGTFTLPSGYKLASSPAEYHGGHQRYVYVAFRL